MLLEAAQLAVRAHAGQVRKGGSVPYATHPLEVARLVRDADGWAVDPFPDQDSSLLRVLTEADALLIRPPREPAQPAGAAARFLPLR